MKNLLISKYCLADNDDAIELEGLCPQGESIKLKFVRSLFHKRSEVYKDYKINCARIGDKLIGVAAGVKKQVKLREKNITALYGYDLRVHPEYRKFGVAKTLTKSILDSFDNDFNYAYSYIAGENERALGLIKRSFGANVCIPLTYIILPVYKLYNVNEIYENIPSTDARNNYLNNHPNLEFVPNYEEKNMLGYIDSIAIGKNASASIWNNELLLAEQVIQMRWWLKFVRSVNILLSPIIKLPLIPKKKEIIKSWFIYDLFAENKYFLKATIMILNNLALKQGRTFIYLLLQDSNPYLKMIKGIKIKKMYLPYFFIAKGMGSLCCSDKIYIDPRDL